MRKITIEQHDWPTVGSFRISRSVLTTIPTLRVSITEAGFTGRGECRPYARYDEDCQSVSQQILSLQSQLEKGLSRLDLQTSLPAGAARNAIDCALWDLEAKQTGKTVSALLGLPVPKPRLTAYTLSVDSPDNMANAAKEAEAYPLLKIKIKASDGLDCALAVLNARPDARLIIDANESLTPTLTKALLSALQGRAIELIEQPLPHDKFETLPAQTRLNEGISPLIICADESLHTQEDLNSLWEAGYRAVNVKLDKCGGLTEGISLMRAAKAMGFKVMAGCMVGSSLAMAPMMMLESLADVIDLDGPLLLSKDIENGIEYEPPFIKAPNRKLWG